MTPRKQRARTQINHEGFHVLLWERSDERRRIHVDIGELAIELGVSNTRVNDTVLAMQEEGRLRGVEWRAHRKRIYEVADPECFDPDDPSTHAARAKTLQWG